METYGEYDEAMYVARMMIKHGGGFVHHLGEALMRADANNTARIKEAFPDYWEQYKEMAADDTARASGETRIGDVPQEDWDAFMKKSAQAVK
jgi:hypothetical protein